MKRYAHKVMLSAVAVVVMVGLSGCATGHAGRFGRVDGAKLGPDANVAAFSFVNQEGDVTEFASVRGKVTIVAFPQERSAWPECQQCHKLERLASRVATSSTPVTIVSVVTPQAGCEDLQAAFSHCKIEGYAQLLALCDPSAKIRQMYGSSASGNFFVIDDRGAIRASGKLDDASSMERALRAAVRSHEEKIARYSTPV